MSTRTLIPALALLAGTCLAQDAQTLPLRVLIDRNLDRQLIELVSIDDTHITYVDTAGSRVNAPRDAFVALAPIDAWDSAQAAGNVFNQGRMISRPGVLELTDGQRFVGTASVADAGEEMIAWNYPRLGLISIPLENVTRIVLPRIMNADQARPPLAVEDDDVLRLANGDTLRGFLASYGSTTTIELDDGSTIDTPINVLDEITLANPTQAPSGMRLWLTGGNIVDAQSISPSDRPDTRAQIITLKEDPISPFGAASAASEADDTQSGLRFEIGREMIEAISFDAEALIPLAAIEARAMGRALAINNTSTAALGARDISMPGPMTATWPIPRGSTRLAFTTELPIEARAWGNLELIILVDGSERQRHTLSAQSPEAHVRLDIENARDLTITLDEGDFGPVQDRVTIREAVLLIGR